MFKKVRFSIEKVPRHLLMRRYWTWILFVSVMMVVSCGQLAGSQNGFGTLITEQQSLSESDMLQSETQVAVGEETFASQNESDGAIVDSDFSDQDDKLQIYVYVCGLVQSPGVYALDEGARQIAAIEAAGGMLPGACADGMNLAAVVTDGERIYVPAIDEVSGTQLLQGSQETGLININTATKEELMTLTGIGESKAQRIIEYRENQGGFPDIEALKNVPGIKEGTYDALKDQITVG